MKHRPIFKGVQSDVVWFDKGFNIPLFTKQTTFSDSSHTSFRNRRRHTYSPLSFKVPIRIYNKNNRLSIDEVIRRVNNFFYSDEPKEFKIPDTDYYFIGEFDGPIEIDFKMNVIMYTEVTFNSEYPYKFYDNEKVQTASKSVIIDSKTQLPTTPLIEVTGVTGNDLQISISGNNFYRFRMTGDLPENITIDIENERIYETLSGVNLMKYFRYNTSFENMKVSDGDTVVLTNDSTTAKAKLTYKELLL